VKLHNDLRGVAARGGFSLLRHDAPRLLIKDAAFQKFSEMSNIGPWLDKQDKLQWDYKFEAGYRWARSVRNGNTTRDALIAKDGHITNKHGKEVITGYHNLGNTTKDALIAKDGHITNKLGKEVIAGYHDLGSLGGNANKDALIEKGGRITNQHGKQVVAGFHVIGNLGGAATARNREATAHHTHICTSALCRRGSSAI